MDRVTLEKISLATTVVLVVVVFISLTLNQPLFDKTTPANLSDETSGMVVRTALPPAPMPQWPFATGAEYNFSSSAITDVDGDSNPEVVFGSDDGKLYIVRSNGALKCSKFLSDVSGVTPSLHSSPTVINVDSDSTTKEIIVGSGLGTAWGRLYILNNNCVELARFDTATGVEGSPLVIDTDGDGKQEVYFGTVGTYTGVAKFYSLKILPSGGAISLVLRWSKDLQSGGSSSMPAAGNIDGVGLPEIVFSISGILNSNLEGKKIYALSSTQGTQLWEYSTTRFNNLNSPTIADIDGDGQKEVLQSSTDGKIYVLNGQTGTLKWSFQTEPGNGTSIMHTQAVGNVDSSSPGLEIVVGGYNSGSTDYLYLLSSTGQVIWRKTFTGENLSFSSPTIADIDNDGTKEIVIGTSKLDPDALTPASVYVIDKFGNTVWVANQTGIVYSSPSVADIDGDNQSEICFGIYDHKHNCLKSDGSQFQFNGLVSNPVRPWTMLNYDFANTRYKP